MEKALSTPYHVFMVPIFFVLHVLNSYFGLIPPAAYFTWAAYYLSLSLVLLFIGRLVTGSYNKSGIWTTCLLCLFFFFGALHDFLKNVPIPSLFASYKMLLPTIAIAIVLLAMWLRKRKATLNKAHRYFNLLWAILILIELITATYNWSTNKEDENNYAHHQPPVTNKQSLASGGSAPDIFFIVFDEYTSSLALKKYYNFNNSELDSILLANKFQVIANSQSNYNSTPLSLASCFNMQYFDKQLEGQLTTTKSVLQSWYSFKKSQLPQLLAQMQYEIRNIGLSDFDNYPVKATRYFTDYERLPLFRETLGGRIKRDIWWHVYGLGIPGLTKLAKNSNNQEAKTYTARNMNNLQSALAELNKQTDQPKFVFAHIMMPHAPFYLNERGQLWENNAAVADLYDTSLYLQQLTYCNQWIDTFARSANRPFKRPRVVIIEGDHGFRDSVDISHRDKQFMNLQAIYFSDNDHRLLYDSMSPVNTFKVVLNKYFEAKIPLSKDSSILLK